MKTLELTAGGVTARLQIREATTLMGMRRGQLAADAKDDDPLIWFARRFMYPDCLACSAGEVDGKPVSQLTFDEYMALPDQITEAWLAAVYEVNPHWQPRLPEEQEKKRSKRSTG
jgi:hypothetical protein